MRTIATPIFFRINAVCLAICLLSLLCIAGCGGGSSDGDGGPDAPVPAAGGSVTGGGGATGGAIVGTGGAGGSAAAACGAPGYTCCPGNTCNGGGCCVNSICAPKGALCATLEGTCNDGACGTCGGAGLACCAGSLCTAAGTKCVGGLCGRCGGGAGTPCCKKLSSTSTENLCLADGLICGTSDYCVSCGKAGDVCCPGSKCDGGGCCIGGRCVAEGQACSATSGTCKANRCSGCGAISQACCSGSLCYDGLLCSTNGLCSQCGGLGEPCCAVTAASTPRCRAGGVCTSEMCAACGGLGQSCCDGKCTQGCCSANRCVEGTALPTGVCGTVGTGGTGIPATCAGVGPSPCASGRMPRFTGVQTLDGQDTEFCNIPAFELNFANAARVASFNAGGTLSERLVAKVAWSSEGVHAYLRVFDSTIVSAPNLTNIWNGDGAELLFSSSTALTGNTATDGNTYHVIVSPASLSGGTSYVASSRSSLGQGTQTALDPSRYVAVTLADGYAVELKLPWPMLIPTVGSNIAFDAQLNSADGPMSTSDSYVRDAQAILYQGAGTANTCGTTIGPYCDDRLWCVVQLQ